MYLDTDIILGLLKKSDWLKPHINIKKIKNPKTSALVLIEAELVLAREYSRKQSLSVYEKVKDLDIQILPVGENIIKKSTKLMEEYPKLNIFDSVHAAFSVIKKETILSTDNVFENIENVKTMDPRKIE